MNFYLDFEATQFSDRIISIGCINETGEKFSTLVKPPKGDKVSKFITELTGITNDDLAGAPSADEAFNAFFDFVLENDDDKAPRFFCYGDCDAEFIKATIRKMNDTRAITFARSILPALFDYSASVKKYFNTDQSIALQKLASFINDGEIVQTHKALDDAIMLRNVANDLVDFCNPEDLIEIKGLPGQPKPQMKKEKKAPDIFINFKGSTWQVDTFGNENNYSIKCYTKDRKKWKYFNNMETAILWLIKYIVGGSPKDEKHIKSRKHYITNAIATGHKYCGMYWEERKGE